MWRVARGRNMKDYLTLQGIVRVICPKLLWVLVLRNHERMKLKGLHRTKHLSVLRPVPKECWAIAMHAMAMCNKLPCYDVNKLFELRVVYQTKPYFWGIFMIIKEFLNSCGTTTNNATTALNAAKNDTSLTSPWIHHAKGLFRKCKKVGKAQMVICSRRKPILYISHNRCKSKRGTYPNRSRMDLCCASIGPQFCQIQMVPNNDVLGLVA